MNTYGRSVTMLQFARTHAHEKISQLKSYEQIWRLGLKVEFEFLPCLMTLFIWNQTNDQIYVVPDDSNSSEFLMRDYLIWKKPGFLCPHNSTTNGNVSCLFVFFTICSNSDISAMILFIIVDSLTVMPKIIIKYFNLNHWNN